MVEFEPGDSKAILRLLHPFQTEMFAEMTEEWCLLFLQSKSESVQDVTRHRWGLWTYVTVTCFVHAGACAILLKWASQVAGSLGVWRSLEARFLGMEEAPSSNLGTSTFFLFSRLLLAVARFWCSEKIFWEKPLKGVLTNALH